MHLSSQRDKSFLSIINAHQFWWALFFIQHNILQEKTFISFRLSGTSAKHSVLFAKNDIPYRFLNAQTYRFDSSFSMHNKKGTLKGTFSALVEMTGVEPAASTSRTWRATICATSRYLHLLLINYILFETINQDILSVCFSID